MRAHSSFLGTRRVNRPLQRLIEFLQVDVANLLAQFIVFGALLFAYRLVLSPTLLCGHVCTLTPQPSLDH
jgi:hypothetical protein